MDCKNCGSSEHSSDNCNMLKLVKYLTGESDEKPTRKVKIVGDVLRELTDKEKEELK